MSSLRGIAKAVYYRIFRVQLRVRIWWADRSEEARTGVPVPPAMLRYRVSELIPVEPFLRIGEGCASLLRQFASEMGVDLAHTGRVLDFGCGCGRTIRWFLDDAPDFSGVEFHGADIDVDAIEWCKKNFRGGRFQSNEPEPPLPYPAEHFGVVYCFSVFTHLDEVMQDLWLVEMSRILNPGGLLLLSIHAAAASEILDEGQKCELQTRGFLHVRSQKLSGLVPDWYQTTWHSREYIVKRLGASFRDVRYFEIAGGHQAIVGARKPD